MTQDRLLVSVVDAATILGVGRTTLYALMTRGEVEHVIIGRRRLVVAESLRAYVEAHATFGEGDAA